MANNGLTVVDSAPVALATKEQVTLAMNRIKTMVADASRMSVDQLYTIAQESLLYRTMPGRDIHYFLSKGKLERTPDYKYLISFVQNKERLATGNPGLRVVFEDRALTELEKANHGVNAGDYAVEVTVSTDQDRDGYRREVKCWLDLGCDIAQAMEAAKRVMGDKGGTSAIGVVKAEDENIPKGWTPLQKARKLAIKAAIRMRWGEPSVDEMMAYVRQMASRDTSPEDWSEIPLELPAEVQAKYASMAAGVREASERDADMTPDERRERLEKNVVELRGEKDEYAIGEEPDREPETNEEIKRGFCKRAATEIPYFNHANHVMHTLKKLGLEYDPWEEDVIMTALNDYASKEADEIQADMFDGQPDIDDALGRTSYDAGA